MLSDCCLSCRSVCDVGALWPNGWMDQDETEKYKMTKLGMPVGLGPRHIVLDGDPAPPPQRGTAPPISAHFYCGQTAGCILVWR